MICDHLGDLCPRCRHGWQNRSGTNSRSCFLSGRSFTRTIPSAATADVSATGSSSTSSCNSCASSALTRRSPTRLARPPRSAAAATSGSDSACSPGSNRSRWSPTTGSSASPSITSLWTAPSPRRPEAARPAGRSPVDRGKQGLKRSGSKSAASTAASRTKVRTHQSRPVGVGTWSAPTPGRAPSTGSPAATSGGPPSSTPSSISPSGARLLRPGGVRWASPPGFIRGEARACGPVATSRFEGRCSKERAGRGRGLNRSEWYAGFRQLIPGTLRCPGEARRRRRAGRGPVSSARPGRSVPPRLRVGR